jgi:hypothetical protein
MALIACEAAWNAFWALRMATSSSFWFTPDIDVGLIRFDGQVACVDHAA